MKFITKVIFLIFLSLSLGAVSTPVWAQAESPRGDTPSAAPEAEPTNLPTGEVSGKIINQNDPSRSLGGLEVTLHVLDQNQNQLGMLHGKTEANGSFTIVDVPFQSGFGYAAAVVYEEIPYYSEVVTAGAGKTSLDLNVTVFETTTDTSSVLVDQMHVLFRFAQDGMEVQEIYALSNLGDRTVRDGVEVSGTDGVRAAVQFTLPEEAQFINFEPQTRGRFHKFSGGFADAAPLVPGEMVSQFRVSYLMPYTTPLTYSLKPTLPVERVNFVVPKESGLSLEGTDLGAPEQVTAQNGQIFDLYRLDGIPAEGTVDLALVGKLILPENQAVDINSSKLPKQMPLILGLSVLGVAFAGGGAFWWIRSAKQANEGDIEEELEDEDLEGTVAEDEKPAFEMILQEIAQLDRAYEAGMVDEDLYDARRSELKTKAKGLLTDTADHQDVLPD